VLKKFPNLKLNLGHFGGVEIWEKPTANDPQKRFETITQLLKTYPNVYGDFSYNFADTDSIPHFLNTLNTQPNFKNKAMFGTDYWVVISEGGAKNDQTFFIDELSKAGLKETVMKTNPQAFLFG